jgi:hypothetical protein
MEANRKELDSQAIGKTRSPLWKQRGLFSCPGTENEMDDDGNAMVPAGTGNLIEEALSAAPKTGGR